MDIKYVLKSGDYVNQSNKAVHSTSNFLHHPRCTKNFPPCQLLPVGILVLGILWDQNSSRDLVILASHGSIPQLVIKCQIFKHFLKRRFNCL